MANAKASGHGVIYTIAPSPRSAGVIWVGTDTGLVHLTRDEGKNWTEVTPAGLPEWSKISLLDASHFDPDTAYAAVDRHRLDDLAPLIYRTHDFGKSWTKITQGIPEGAYVRAVREDSIRKGLLFAGTELGVYFSVDDGDHWQPLQLNLPVTPVHDLVVKDKDLVIATHGRSFWILDDITPLRELTTELTASSSSKLAAETVHLFAPARAVRIRASVNHDTPLPPEEPAGENPPAGAIIYYYLKSTAQEVRLEVLDSAGHLVRSYSSAESSVFTPPSAPFPAYWFRPPGVLSAEGGMHRFVWDLRYPAVELRDPNYSIAAVYGWSAPREPQGPLALPGAYTVKLTADGQSITQPLELMQDPRISTSAADLEKQFVLVAQLTDALARGSRALTEIRAFYSQNQGSEASAKVQALSEIEPPEGSRPRRGMLTISGVVTTLAQLSTAVESADTAPTVAETEAAKRALSQLESLLKRWAEITR